VSRILLIFKKLNLFHYNLYKHHFFDLYLGTIIENQIQLAYKEIYNSKLIGKIEHPVIIFIFKDGELNFVTNLFRIIFATINFKIE
jgi:hypothetical protein